MITATPLAASLRIRSITTSVCVTPSAAVGSSMITSRASAMTARATATPWRWPPESEPTGWRIERTVVTERLAERLLRLALHRRLLEDPEAAELLAEKHVRDDVEVVAEREVLVDGGDAEIGGVVRRAHVHGLPSQ